MDRDIPGRAPYEGPPTEVGVDHNSSADDRDQTADARDQISEAHDKASAARDDQADARDDRAEAREYAARRLDTGAAADRSGAWRDRRGAATDRGHAADDRGAASTDRALSARERKASSFDDLTGAYRRQTGLVEFARERARAKRTLTPLTIAFVDVDGLKLTNDTLGHAAGDQLLRRVVDALRAHLRPYDLIMRFGGDEFLCALNDCTIDEVAERFKQIAADLADNSHASITAGFAELKDNDSLDDLIDRADTALRAERRRRASARP